MAIHNGCYLEKYQLTAACFTFPSLLRSWSCTAPACRPQPCSPGQQWEQPPGCRREHRAQNQPLSAQHHSSIWQRTNLQSCSCSEWHGDGPRTVVLCLFPQQHRCLCCKFRLKQAGLGSLPLVSTFEVGKATVQQHKGLCWSWPAVPSTHLTQ